ncbi:MAG: sulfotransferase [Alphaproteobacteria bacterium]|nr:sulfotransferase [Alphaproteobacteria bacterium]
MSGEQDLWEEADRHRAAGRLVEAEAAYRRLLALKPDLPDSWYNLGLVQRQAGKFEESLKSYQRALDHHVGRPEEVHLNRGVIYADHLRRDAEAEREYAAALAASPGYIPALLNLANLAEDRGRRDEALGYYERALKVDPRCYIALARSAQLRKVNTSADPLVARLRNTILMGGAKPDERAALGFALGKLLDGCGAYDESFAAYAAANRAGRQGLAAYDGAAQEAFTDRMIETFSGKQSAEAGPSPAVFVCGMFRSGSTLAEQVLAAHPRVTAGGEIDFFAPCIRDVLSPYPEAVKAASPQALADIAARYRARIAQLFPDAAVVTDKRPGNFLHIGLIKALFPDAKIVHTVRDPLDTCLSVYFTYLDQPYAHDLSDIAHYTGQYRRLMAHWKALFGDDIFDFDYDAFVAEPRPATERLLAFCGLDWDDACLDFHRNTNAVKTASVWQVREPLYRRSSGRWRNYAQHLQAVRAALEL